MERQMVMTGSLPLGAYYANLQKKKREIPAHCEFVSLICPPVHPSVCPFVPSLQPLNDFKLSSEGRFSVIRAANRFIFLWNPSEPRYLSHSTKGSVPTSFHFTFPLLLPFSLIFLKQAPWSDLLAQLYPVHLLLIHYLQIRFNPIQPLQLWCSWSCFFY